MGLLYDELGGVSMGLGFMELHNAQWEFRGFSLSGLLR